MEAKQKNTDIRKELRRLSRTDLLELMVEQSRELEKTRRELAAAREEIAAKDDVLSERAMEIARLEEKYNKREIRLQNAGSIAEASLVLSGIFEAAQKAGDIYLQNVRRVTGYAVEAEPEAEETPAEQIRTEDAAAEHSSVEKIYADSAEAAAEATEQTDTAESMTEAPEETDTEAKETAVPEEATSAEESPEAADAAEEPAAPQETQVESSKEEAPAEEITAAEADSEAGVIITEDDEYAEEENGSSEHIRHRHGRPSRAALRSAAEAEAAEGETDD